MRVRPPLAAALVLLTALVAGTPAAAGVRSEPRLTNSGPCVGITDFTCSDLIVPLDRSRRVRGDLTLKVAVAGNTTAPRGTLLFLTGGPGQPGVSLVPRIQQRLAPVLADYRLVMIDQRGTGDNGIDCPKLQAEVGSSDVTPPSPGAVQECADLLGRTRDFYTTADTVADLEDLRSALRVPRWTIDGVSYGSFVAIQYGLTHPLRVDRMVLDSVVPQRGVPALYRESLARTAYVLRTACAEQNCGFDPAADLATVVNRYGNGVDVFNFLVIASIVDPKLTGSAFFPVLPFLHMAAQGETGP
ncbi:alpha/beta fold hydrolase, partial [Asanoa iriomotensis]